MSYDLLKPKEQRLKRLEEEKAASEVSISNFNFCYKMPCKGIDSDEEAEKKGESAAAHCYSVNFEDDEDGKSNSKSVKSRRGLHRTLYERLTEKVQGQMELVEGLILQYHQQEVSLETVKKAMDGIRVVTRDPSLEFDDFTNLKNFDQELSRQSLQAGPVSCRKLPLMAFNNVTSLVKLDLDLETQTHTLKPLLKVKENEIICSVSMGTGVLANTILVAGVLDNSIIFMDAQKECVLFRVAMDSDSASKSVVSAINSGSALWVLFEDWTLQHYDINSSDLIKTFQIPAYSSPLSANFPEQMILLKGQLVIATTSSIFLFDLSTGQIRNLGMAGIMDTCTVNKLRAASDDLLILSPLGSDRIYIYSISSAKYSELQLPGKSILSFDVNQVTGDVVALVEVLGPKYSEGSVETKRKLRLLILVEVNGSLVEEDFFEVFSEAKTVTFVGSQNFVVVEGNLSFSVLCVNDTKLGNQIKDSLLKTLNGTGLRGLGSNELQSTKENTGGPCTPTDETSGLNTEHINQIIDFCIASSGSSPSEDLKKNLSVNPHFARLIDDRLLEFKEKLKRELHQEMQAELEGRLRDRVREEVTVFLRSQLNKSLDPQPPSPV